MLPARGKATLQSNTGTRAGAAANPADCQACLAKAASKKGTLNSWLLQLTAISAVYVHHTH